MATEPVDRLAWQISGIKHHGVLMSVGRTWSQHSLAQEDHHRGGSSDLPTRSLELGFRGPDSCPWGLSSVAHLKIQLMEHGRIEFGPSTKHWTGIVIAAPHGSFDRYTADLVRRISSSTAAGVIAIGFTPTETSGWRINVNRPSERHYPDGAIEIGSGRSKAVYEAFRETVLRASAGELKLHVDLHQNGRQPHIEVATLGVSVDEARIIKAIYQEAREEVLSSVPNGWRSRAADRARR